MSMDELDGRTPMHQQMTAAASVVTIPVSVRPIFYSPVTFLNYLLRFLGRTLVIYLCLVPLRILQYDRKFFMERMGLIDQPHVYCNKPFIGEEFEPLVPSHQDHCKTCPDNATCEGGDMKCDGGYIQLEEKCLEDTESNRLLQHIYYRSLDVLEAKSGLLICEGTPSQQSFPLGASARTLKEWKKDVIKSYEAEVDDDEANSGKVVFFTEEHKRELSRIWDERIEKLLLEIAVPLHGQSPKRDHPATRVHFSIMRLNADPLYQPAQLRMSWRCIGKKLLNERTYEGIVLSIVLEILFYLTYIMPHNRQTEEQIHKVVTAIRLKLKEHRLFRINNDRAAALSSSNVRPRHASKDSQNASSDASQSQNGSSGYTEWQPYAVEDLRREFLTRQSVSPLLWALAAEQLVVHSEEFQVKCVVTHCGLAQKEQAAWVWKGDTESQQPKKKIELIPEEKSE